MKQARAISAKHAPAKAVSAKAVSAKDNAPSKQRLRTWLRLLKTSRAIETELRERLRVQFDTTLPRFDVLAALYRAENGMKMSELSSFLRVSNGNVTVIVERLVNDGLIVRVPVEDDRRAMLVRLTPKGAEDFTTLAKAHESWIDELMSGLDIAETTDFIAKLDRIRAHPEAAR